jgi:hypothetical protein
MIPGAVTPLPAGDAGNAAAGNAAAGNAAAGNAAAAAVAGVRAPAGAATPPAVQIISALAGLTANDNGTVTPTGSVNLAFPGSGIGGSLPLSLPSASPVQPAQPTFPAADPNAVVNDPVFQGLIQSFAQQPSVNQPGPILDPLSNIATAPATPVSAGTQLAANTFGLDGNPVASDVSPLPASSFQALAQNADTPGTPGTGTLSPGTPSVGSPITVAPPQGSILMTQPGFFGNTVTTLNPGTEMTLSDGTKLQVTHDNFLSVTPPNGDTYEIAPGSTYTLPDGSGSQIMVPTVPPLLYQQPGYSDQILTPGTHFSTQDGSTIEVTQDGVLRVTTPQGNQMDYAPGSTYTLPGGGGGTISVLAPPQAMNTDLNPATQIGGTPTAGTQLAANTFDGNGSPVASDASQLPVQLAQNQAATPSLTPNSMTVILPDGTAQTFPLGTSDNLTGPPTFGPGSVIMVPLGTQVPLSSGGSMTIDSPGKLIFPGAPELPTVQGIPAVPTSDNSTGGTTAVAMNTSPPTGNPVTTDAGCAGGATQPPVTQPPVDTTQPPVVVQPPVDTTQPPVTQPPVVQPPVDTTQPPVTQPPVDTTQPPVTQPPVDTTQPPALISSDPTVGADPVVASLGGGSFAGGGSFGGSGGGSG